MNQVNIGELEKLFRTTVKEAFYCNGCANHDPRLHQCKLKEIEISDGVCISRTDYPKEDQ